MLWVPPAKSTFKKRNGCSTVVEQIPRNEKIVGSDPTRCKALKCVLKYRSIAKEKLS